MRGLQLQRIGRTGRKRDGYVHVLLSEDREERNWEKADDNYKDVQRFIIKAEHLELYEDVERLIPDHIKPECIEMEMEIEEYVREEPRAKKGPLSPLPRGKKRVRNDDVMRNVPEGASTGFVSVKNLLQKSGKKRKKPPPPVDFEHAAESDDDDKALEEGILAPRRTVSMTATEQSKTKKIRRSTTVANENVGSSKKRTARARKKQPAAEDVTLSDLNRLGQSDSDDETIAQGVTVAKPLTTAKGKKRKKPPSPPPSPRKRFLSSSPAPEPGPSRNADGNGALSILEPTTPPQWSSSPARPLADASIVDLTTPGPHLHRSLPPSSPLESRWPSLECAIPSPKQGLKCNSSTGSPVMKSRSVSSHSVVGEEREEVNDNSMAWLLDDDDDDANIIVIGSSPPMNRVARLHPTTVLDDSEIEIVGDQRLFSLSPVHLPGSLSQPRPSGVVPDEGVQHSQDGDDLAMPPPPVPARTSTAIAVSSDPLALEPITDVDIEPELDDEASSDAFPAATFAIRIPGRQANKRVRLETAIDSSPAMPPPSQRRLHRATTHSPSPARQRSPDIDPQASEPRPRPPKRKKRKFADAVDAQRHNPWIDVEAAHSGDELSQGSDEDAYDSSMLASEGDIQFAGDFHPTQASPSYDQAAVYRRSLLTQAPGDRKSTRLNSSHSGESRMPSSA